jgi:heme-degrading monooxygenase HmoA
MPVIVTTHIPALPPEAYDETARRLAGALRASEGFIAHAASADAAGLTVVELWEAEASWRRFFDAHVRPGLPGDLPEPTVAELRNAILAG